VCANDPATCNNAKQAYQQLRTQLLSESSLGCTSDAECVVIAPINQCDRGCQYAAVVAQFSDSFTLGLQSYAYNSECSTCYLRATPPCDAPAAARCVMGQCSLASQDQ